MSEAIAVLLILTIVVILYAFGYVVARMITRTRRALQRRKKTPNQQKPVKPTTVIGADGKKLKLSPHIAEDIARNKADKALRDAHKEELRLFDEELNQKSDRDNWKRTLRRHGIIKRDT